MNLHSDLKESNRIFCVHYLSSCSGLNNLIVKQSVSISGNKTAALLEFCDKIDKKQFRKLSNTDLANWIPANFGTRMAACAAAWKW